MQEQTTLKISYPEGQSLVQLIVFRTGNEDFGVPIDMVREIIKIGAITPIPDSPKFIKGIINVRGEIVTTIDMKSLFALPEDHLSDPKHIIVTKQEDSLFGLIVDEVVEVLRVQEKEINPTPDVISKIHQTYISGVVTHDDRLIIVLNLGRVLAQKELIRLAHHLRKILEKRKNKEG